MCRDGKTERENGAAPRLPRGTDWINEGGTGGRRRRR